MSCTKELAAWKLDLDIVTTADMFIWEKQWHPSMGVSAVDLTSDMRNGTGAGSATYEIRPAMQFAPVRTDRPDPGLAIAAAATTPILATTTIPLHWQETVTSATKFWWRRGLTFKLLTGTYAKAEMVLYTSFRSCGTIFPAKEIVFNPLNDKAVENLFPLTGPFPCIGVDKVKAAIVGMDNLNDKIRYDIYGRAFNDPMARGGWTSLLGATQPSPTTGDFAANTGELAVTGLSLATKQWMELALGVKKNADIDAGSRCIFHVVLAVKYA